MKIIFIGDIVGRPGRDTVKRVLAEVRTEFKPDLVFANAENLSHGDGFTTEVIEEMRKAGIDYFSSGDHVFGNKESMGQLNDAKFPVIRPANFPPGVPGRGYTILEDGMMNKVLFINLIGRVFMKKDYDCPFRAVDAILRETAHESVQAIFVDMHAEATSEKYAMAFYLDGRVSAVVGTHTHVPTADARILDMGTAFMSDVGMSGSLDSVIGVKKEIIISSFLTQMPVKHELEDHGKMVFNAVFVELDEKTRKALNVKHIQKII